MKRFLLVALMAAATAAAAGEVDSQEFRFGWVVASTEPRVASSPVGPVSVYGSQSDDEVREVAARVIEVHLAAYREIGRPAADAFVGIKVLLVNELIGKRCDYLLGSRGAYFPSLDLIVVSRLFGSFSLPVAEHEAGHRIAWKLGLRGRCSQFQGHPGGFNLRCERIPVRGTQ